MRFSVIVPVYNVEKYLEPCLHSLQEQLCADAEPVEFDCEFLLIDDGSTDSSGEMCDRWVSGHPEFRVIHQENRGLSGARNTGLEQAVGDWLLFVDSDDIMMPGTLRRLNHLVDRYPADGYRFNMLRIEEDGTPEVFTPPRIIEYEPVRFRSEKERFDFYSKRLMQYRIGWEACSGVYRRRVVEEHHLRFTPTAEVFAEDYLFNFQYLLYVERLMLLCDRMYGYRRRGGSLLAVRKAETVLPRMNRLAELAYETCRREGRKPFCRGFSELYFRLMNYMIRYSLAELPMEKIREQFSELEQRELPRRWMKELRSNRNAYMLDMEWSRRWL